MENICRTFWINWFISILYVIDDVRLNRSHVIVCQDRRFLGILTTHNFVEWQILKQTLTLPSFHVEMGSQLVCAHLSKHSPDGVSHIVPTQSTQQSNLQENNSNGDSLLVCTSLPYSL